MTACTIHAEGRALVLTIPSPKEGLSHSVEVPCTLPGVKLLHRILTKRAAWNSPMPAYLGTDASPTQLMVEEWLRQDREAAAQARLNPELEVIELDL